VCSRQHDAELQSRSGATPGKFRIEALGAEDDGAAASFSSGWPRALRRSAQNRAANRHSVPSRRRVFPRAACAGAIRATASALRASQARWKPPRPLIATIFPSLQQAQGFGQSGRQWPAPVRPHRSKLQLRAAHPGSKWFRHESAGRPWAYSACAAGTQHKAGHAGAARGRRAGCAADGVARAAMGAVDEGVAPAPVVTDRKVSVRQAGQIAPRPGRWPWQPPFGTFGRITKSRRAWSGGLGLSMESTARQRVAPRSARHCVNAFHQRLAAFNLRSPPRHHRYAPSRSRPSELAKRYTKGRKAHALDHATHAQAAGNTGRINNNQHGRFRLSRHVRHPAPLRGL
jgi:hypothetical protein